MSLVSSTETGEEDEVEVGETSTTEDTTTIVVATSTETTTTTEDNVKEDKDLGVGEDKDSGVGEDKIEDRIKDPVRKLQPVQHGKALN